MKTKNKRFLSLLLATMLLTLCITPVLAVEDGHEHDCEHEHEVAVALMAAVACGGNEVVEFTCSSTQAVPCTHGMYGMDIIRTSWIETRCAYCGILYGTHGYKTDILACGV